MMPMRWVPWMFAFESLMALGCAAVLFLEGKGGGWEGVAMHGLGLIAGMSFVQSLRPPPRL